MEHSTPKTKKARKAGPGRRAWPLIAAAAGLAWMLGAAASAPIYRYVDKDGNTVFSDVPPRPQERAEPVQLGEGNTFRADELAVPTSTEPSWDWEPEADQEDEEADEARFGYQTLAITFPADDEAVRQNDGNVTVVAGIEPELRPSHRLQLLLDGQLVQTSPGTSFPLLEVDRGTHTLQVQVVNDAGDVLMTSATTTFHLQRYAPRLAPNRP